MKRTNLASIPSATLDDFFELNAIRSRVQAELQRFWLDNKLDALLYPPAPTTATPLDDWKCITYTMLWNMLDYPAAIIPTGKVSSADKVDSIENAKFGPEDQENYKICKVTGAATVDEGALLTYFDRHWPRRFPKRSARGAIGGYATGRRRAVERRKTRR